MERSVVDNRYVLSGLLGGGGMGRVYLARDEVLERDVALKVLREQYAGDEGFVGRFEREARAAASLNHPNIVLVYDRGKTEDGDYYIAMEHVPGGTLKDRILQGGAVEAAEAIRLALQVADALGVAHASGIVHRDVKPHNVLLTAAGDAKVADFGIARAASEVSVSGSSHVLGTAKYMSPEQAVGDPVGPASDLYSLGVVLYEMLTGELPFEADSAVGVAMKHVNEPPCPPVEKNPAVPGALNDVVVKLLEKKPEDRYPGAAELVADLSRAGEGLSPVFAAPAASGIGTEQTEMLATPDPGATRRDFSPSRAKRKRTLILLAATALVALLGLAGLGLLRGPGGQVLGSLGETAKVPGVVGSTEGEARERLAERGFGVEVERKAGAGQDEGRVLEQSIPAGTEADRGSRVALTVGGSPRTVRAPGLANLTPSQAQDELEKAGLRLGDRELAPSENVPEGEVAAQDPGAGKKARMGTGVDLIVSSGPPVATGADRVEVPDVSNLDVGGATARLEEAGYEVDGSRTISGPEPEGTVLSTDPPVGTALASGTTVIVVVSGGPGAPPAGAPSGDPGRPAPPASASASSGASAPSETSAGPGPSSPEPPADTPEPSPSPSSTPSPSPTAPASPSPEDGAEDTGEETG